MINVLMLVLNTLLSLTLVFLMNKIIKETHQEDEKEYVSKKEINKKEMSHQQKRDLEILDQIQRYDGTRILRKEV